MLRALAQLAEARRLAVQVLRRTAWLSRGMNNKISNSRVRVPGARPGKDSLQVDTVSYLVRGGPFF